ncbi:PKD domain-containing protein, partial [Candidatus Bipolaricaulota bacterium]|nr:PKD domain-containing protein [Candidatus Bipolaricaulota bacterium]
LNSQPAADFTAAPTTGLAPLIVDFDGSIIAYQRDFGDEDTGNGQTIAHTCDSFGTFTVTLIVLDYSGRPVSDVAEIRRVIFIGPITFLRCSRNCRNT